MPTDSIVILAREADRLSRLAIEALDPERAARIVKGAYPFIAVKTQPLAVRICIEEPSGGMLALGDVRGQNLSPEFDQAVAALLKRQIEGLAPDRQEVVSRRLRAGAALALVVAAQPFCVEVLLIDGPRPSDVQVLARIDAPESIH